MTPKEALKAAAHAAQAVMAAQDGRPIDAARHAIDAALELVPDDEARRLLDDAALRRANAIADAAEAAKFNKLADLDEPGDETWPGSR